MIPHILKSDSITLFPAGKAPVILNSTHMNFLRVQEAIREGRYDDAVELASVPNFLRKISAGAVTMLDDEITYNGQPLTGYLASRIVAFANEGLPVEHYLKFLDNLMANDSRTSREELYQFLEAANLPVTEDGCFLAYKAVRSDFRDIHSGRFDNSPGVTHTMPRREVDDNRNQTCSYGFHAAAFEYAKGFMRCDGKMVAVKINPADVVSIPADYNNQKLRCCKYTVVFEIPGAADIFTGKPFYSLSSEPVFDPEENSYFWGDLWNDDDANDDDDDQF